MPETLEQLRAEIERLKRERDELKSRGKTPASPEVSIRGVETFAMRIGPDEQILHINTAFAGHLGVSRDDVVGQKADILRRSLNQEMLMAIARPEEGGSQVRMANDDRGKVFQIKTTLHDGILDVVMEDVTDEQKFRNLVQRYVLKDFHSLSDEELRTFRFPERRFMTVSFTDLRGFTKLVEALEPEDVRGMINAYFEEVIRVVEANEATVAQLVGDEVVAFYGAPRYFKDHALRAIKTACEQIEKVDELCARYNRAGKEMCRCGVGINTGDVVLGNMGSISRQAYTALGTAVNVASRLCGAAGEGQILLTEVVLEAVLDALPAGWEAVESRSMIESEEVTSVGGKIEGVQRLPDELKGKMISIGAGIKSQNKPAEFSFHYLYVLKPKGLSKPLPVITVRRTKHGRSSRMLSDERVSSQRTEIMLGKYRLVEAIGEGGMGKVWKARDQFGNTVAIKMLRAGQSASSHQLERFKREAAIMAKLSHRNICHIHEIAEAEGAIFIAMEYVDGVSLAEVIRHSGESSPNARGTYSQRRGSDLSDLIAEIKEGKKTAAGSGPIRPRQGQPLPDAMPAGVSSTLMLPTQRVLSILCEVCEGIQFAHEHGVFHRDLKPGNIMIRPDGEPVVMDFGLAKVQAHEHEGEASLSIEGQIVGTIEYMAPEQALSSKHVTERADVYSLGAILYQLLTGQKHFHSSGNLVIDAEKLRDCVPVPLRKIDRSIDKDLETIVLKALHADPGRRYSSVSQMREDIRRYQAGDPISARRPTIAYRLTTRMRKHRAAYLFSAAILFVVLMFGGTYYVEWRKQWGNWTEEFKVDFSQAPPAGPAQRQWLTQRFAFQNREATSPAEPWPVRNGAMVMRQHEWCWLQNVRIRDDTKVVVELRFNGKPEAFQICINAKKRLRQWDHNPPGYSCRFGIWRGSMDLITRNEFDRRNDFNSLLVSATPQIFALPEREEFATARGTATQAFSLAFQRQGETVSLQVNGKDVHQDTYLMPLLGEHDAQRGRTGYYENIGIRTWGTNVEVLRVYAYRFKLPEKASPTIAGDSLVETGYLIEAIEKYMTIAKDYENVSSFISTLALTKGYLLAVQIGDVRSRNDFLAELREPIQGAWWHSFPSASRTKYLNKVQEVETLMLWKEGRHRDALRAFPAIFKANPETRIVVECLQAEHQPLDSEVSGELLHWVEKTTKLAGLDISAFGMTDLGALATVHSLRGLDCRNNRLTDLDSLRSMDQLRALYCGHNEIANLEPIKALSIFELYCDNNRIASLEPLRDLPLETLYCGHNRIKDLAPLKGKPIYALDCSHNQIRSLDPISGMPELGQLYCGSNQISSIEPLGRAKNLGYLDCSDNAIRTLEPLQDLQLYSLDCSGNRIVTLEPFVDTKNPPPTFVFDCDTLPDEEIERAIAAWSVKGLKFHVSYGQLLLALRHDRFDKIKSLASEFADHRYLYVQKRLTAQEAEQFCAKLGGHLVTITSEKVNVFLSQITPAETSCRIGLVASDGRPNWVTGEEVEKNFVPALTDFRPSDKIVTWNNGRWLPLSSQEDKPMPFIIEWD